MQRVSILSSAMVLYVLLKLWSCGAESVDQSRLFLKFLHLGRKLMQNFKKSGWSLLVSLAIFSPQALHADPVLVFDEATGDSGANSNQSVGWQFDVLSPITVNGLGWFDEDGDGLALGHSVGLWDPSGTLIDSVFVLAGTAAPLDGQFRTASIPSIVLPVGTGYIVGGENFDSNPERLSSNVSQVLDARLRYIDATFSSIGTGFVRPASFSTAVSGFYGPSFSVVPEPTALALALLAFGFCPRRSRR